MRFQILAIILGLALLSSADSFVSVAAGDPSPTGRSPKLLWTAERQAVWNRMKADYEKNPDAPDTLGGQWYKVVKHNAECACRYGDTGLWATFMYQWTGEQRYVELAWDKLSGFIRLPPASTDGNFIREHGMEKVVLLDWLWPGLSPQRRRELTASISGMLTHALKANQRLNDSDQVVGTYFAVVLFYLTHPDNAASLASYRHQQIGGLSATAADRTTARNAIREYVEHLASGGEWIESAAYNLGTVSLLLMGSEAVRTATGVDHFPEATRWTQQWAKRQIAFWTPDLAQSYQWGDEENPRDNRLFRWTNASGLTAGLLQGTPVGQQLQQQILDLIAKYGPTGHASMEPTVTGRLFFTFNPYAQTTEWRADRTFHAPGTGLILQRSGFDKDDSLFAAHLAPRPGRRAVDHLVRYFHDFELWRKGEWVITHPRGYGGVPITGPGANAVLMHGFGDMLEFKELVGAASSDTFAYQVGTSGGAAVNSTHYNPPPVFVHEWTRSLLYVAGSTDTIIAYDRAHVTDVLRRDRYHPRDQAIFDKAPSAKQWLLHMPVGPKIGPNAISWATLGGQPVLWHPLLPKGSVKTPFDEAALRKSGDPAWKANVKDSELKHHVRVWPSVKQDWDTFLNVIQVGEPGRVDIVSVPGEVEGVRVSRPGAADVLALFNGRPSGRLDHAAYHPSHDVALRRARLRSTEFAIKWRAAGDTTEVFVADLDPAKRWIAELDGQVLLPSSSAGADLLTLMVSGAGDHSLALKVTGNADIRREVVTSPAAPTGLRITR